MKITILSQSVISVENKRIFGNRTLHTKKSNAAKIKTTESIRW